VDEGRGWNSQCEKIAFSVFLVMHSVDFIYGSKKFKYCFKYDRFNFFIVLIAVINIYRLFLIVEQ